MSPEVARVGSPAPVVHVGYWGKTRQHLLVLSFTGFDPFRSSPSGFQCNAQDDFLLALAAWVEMFRGSAREWCSFRLRVALVWPCRRHYRYPKH
jgi:hypothetical protein